MRKEINGKIYDLSTAVFPFSRFVWTTQKNPLRANPIRPKFPPAIHWTS
jgi:hypothetical protein